MQLEHVTLTLFAACNFIRLFAYVPQIYRAATDRNGASAISCTTWSLFLVANIATVAYAIVNLADWWVAACFTCNGFFCVAIIAVAYWRRTQHALANPDQPRPRERWRVKPIGFACWAGVAFVLYCATLVLFETWLARQISLPKSSSSEWLPRAASNVTAADLLPN